MKRIRCAMWVNILCSVSGFPSLLGLERTYAIVHDGDDTAVVMSHPVSYTPLVDVNVEVGETFTVQSTSVQYKFFSTKQNSNSYLQNEDNGDSSFTATEPGVFFLGLIQAPGYGSVEAKRYRVLVTEPHSPSVPPNPIPPSSPPIPMPSSVPPQPVSPSLPPNPIRPNPVPSSTPLLQCHQTADYIVVGSGAGGSAAAGMFRRLGADFLWLEAGEDESSRLREYPAKDGASMPTTSWTPTSLTAEEQTIPYAIPLGTGGMTGHYVGVQYWTREDTVRSLQMKADEEEALDFVRNVTNSRVRCDVFDERYHTHARTPSEPAPSVATSSFPMCMYGECKGARCELNKWFHPVATNDNMDWYRNSAFLEYGSEGILLNTKVIGLSPSDGSASIVRGVVAIRDNVEILICANRALILAAGVMGNAKLLTRFRTYGFFAQPVAVYADSDLMSGTTACDEGSLGGGTVHRWASSTRTGFLSTFAICRVAGENRVAWATPQAIHPKVNGTVTEYGAYINFNDPNLGVMAKLREDVHETFYELFDVNVTLPGDTFSYAAYHWTGSDVDVQESLYQGWSNLYVGDAMGVTGVTSGWTSFNARVSGALSALRAHRAHAGQTPPSSPPDRSTAPVQMIIIVTASVLGVATMIGVASYMRRAKK